MLDYSTLTSTAERKLRECADQASTMVEKIEFRQRLDMGHGIWQLWLELAGMVDKAAARRDMDRLYALIEPESISGLRAMSAGKK
ncbi:hypothetical protein [Janthinobacterium sp. TND4EL3]|uniref:hypothetical protein n=1 Tax=Janthinobacterium sp. TND4EL3 TaxID=1907311 RepID=UPI000970DA22|nr:hypothetical protein [Janthinobacterium sp. TND4EL3]